MTFLIVYSSNKIQEHDKKTQLTLLDINQRKNLINFYKNEITDIKLNKILIRLGGSLVISEKEVLPEIKTLQEKHEKKEISTQEYLNAYYEITQNQLVIEEKKHDLQADNLKRILENPPKIFGYRWNKIRDITYILQFIAIMVLLIINFPSLNIFKKS